MRALVVLFSLPQNTSIKWLAERALHSDFINVRRSDVMYADPISAKRHWWHDCVFSLFVFGSSREKAMCKNVGEIDPSLLPRYLLAKIGLLKTNIDFQSVLLF